MTNKFAKIHFAALLACAGACALPGMAYAGTSTATGSAAMNVGNQCSVTGANVDIGTYTTNQTMGDVAADLGYWGGAGGRTFFPGARGDGAMTLGSVTCDAGTPYTLNIDVAPRETGDNVFEFTLGTKALRGTLWGHSIGDQLLGSNDVTSPNNWWLSETPAPGVGTGAPQVIKGNIFIDAAYSTMTFADKLEPAGTYSTPLYYTLNF